MTRGLPANRRSPIALACAALLGLVAFCQVCAAASAPQVPAGLDDFRHGRFAEALAAWRQADRAGDPRGALYIGALYDSGVGVPRDFREAMQWYRRAAAGGSVVAAFNIGVLYDGGFGVNADQSEAAAWYAKAAADGFGRADYNLAMLYEAGAGVPHDRERAVALFHAAAAQGISAAAVHLAALHAPIGKLPREPGASPERKPVEDSASQELQHAQEALLNRGAADARRATRLFRQAANGHNAVAEYDLGYCYEHGLGLTADPAKAAQWYRRAASDASDDALRSVAQASATTLEEQSATPASDPVR